MSLNKKQMVRAIGRRTQLKNRDVQRVVETLVEVWTEELVSGGRIELENFLVLEVQTIASGANPGNLIAHRLPMTAPRRMKRIKVKPSKALRRKLKSRPEE